MPLDLLGHDYCLRLTPHFGLHGKGVEMWWPSPFVPGCVKRRVMVMPIVCGLLKRVTFDFLGVGNG